MTRHSIMLWELSHQVLMGQVSEKLLDGISDIDSG